MDDIKQSHPAELLRVLDRFGFESWLTWKYPGHSCIDCRGLRQYVALFDGLPPHQIDFIKINGRLASGRWVFFGPYAGPTLPDPSEVESLIVEAILTNTWTDS